MTNGIISAPYTSLKFTHQGKDYFVIHRSTSPPKFTRFGSQDLDRVFRGKTDKLFRGFLLRLKTNSSSEYSPHYLYNHLEYLEN